MEIGGLFIFGQFSIAAPINNMGTAGYHVCLKKSVEPHDTDVLQTISDKHGTQYW